MKKEIPRVAHIVGKWLGGGVEAVIMNYYRNIDKSKVQFDFICDDDSTNIPYEEIEKLGGRVILIPPYQKVFKYQKELKKIFKENNYKIVHSHINTLSVFPLFAAKCAGVKTRIAHSHSTTNKKEWKKNLLKQVLRPFSKLFATDYMCCSELAGRWLFGNKTYDKGEVYLLNNAIDLDKFQYDEKVREAKRKELGIKKDTIVIGHIGRFVAQKNHSFLIDIFSEFHKKNENSILLLAGQGPLMDEIKDKVKSLGLDKNVEFLGQRSDANELYQAFDVFLLPSLYEGLPVVGVEAQAAGSLCLLSDDMTKETKVLETTKFMSLSNTAKEWANELTSLLSTFKRTNTKKEVSSNGFNIKDEGEKLEKYYSKRNKLKVCHVVSGLKSGGVESVVYNYCSLLDRDSFDFHILHQHTASEKNIKEFEELGFHIQEIPYKIKHPIKNMVETYKYLKNNNIEVVHAHMTLMNFIPMFIAKLLNIPIRISHSHQADIKKKSVPLLIIEKILKTVNILCSTNLIACGKDAGKYLYKNNEFKVLRNALNLDKFTYNDENRNKIRKLYKIKEDEFLIGHVGRFSYEKNHKFIISIFEKLIKKNQKIKLILIGDGELKAEIEQLVKDKKLENNVVFTGIVSNVNEIYSALDLFILPSIVEGLPVVGLEAQAANLPCLFSNNIDEDSVVVENNTKLLKIEEETWIKNINEVIKNNKVINNREKDKNPIDYFRDKKLDIKENVKELEDLYKEERKKTSNVLFFLTTFVCIFLIFLYSILKIENILFYTSIIICIAICLKAKASLFSLKTILINYVLISIFFQFNTGESYGILQLNVLSLKYELMMIISIIYNYIIYAFISKTNVLELERNKITQNLESKKILSYFYSMIAILSAIIAFPYIPIIQEAERFNALLPGNAWNHVTMVALLLALPNLSKSKFVQFSYVFCILWFVLRGERVDILGLIILLLIIKVAPIIYNFTKEKIKEFSKYIIVIAILLVSFVTIGEIRGGNDSLNVNTIIRKVLIQNTAADIGYVYNSSIHYVNEEGYQLGKTYISYAIEAIPLLDASEYEAAIILRDKYSTPGGILILAEPYMNFGILGIIIFALIEMFILYMILKNPTKYSTYVYLFLIMTAFRTSWYGIKYIETAMIYIMPLLYFVCRKIILFVEEKIHICHKN